MIPDKNELYATRNGKNKNPIIHGKRKTQERPAFMNPKTLGKLPGEIRIDERFNGRTASFLKIVREFRKVGIKALRVLYDELFFINRSRCRSAACFP